jgi:glycerol uptake facilitator protein
MGMRESSLRARCVAEALGTFLLVFFGCGSVHAAVLAGAQSGVWQVAVVWGVAIMVAIYTVGGISGAHINPAITIAFAAWGRFPYREIPAYVGSQLAGAFLGAATLFVLFGGLLAAKEAKEGVVRGQPGSELTACCYGEFFPNPGTPGAFEAYRDRDDARLKALVSVPAAFAAEVLGTLILALVVFALTDVRNLASPGGKLAPVFIGLTVAILISVIAPLTQACFNPARDVGPRLFAALAGWGRAALPRDVDVGLPGVYVIAPILGAMLGGGLYTRFIAPAFPLPPEMKID